MTLLQGLLVIDFRRTFDFVRPCPLLQSEQTPTRSQSIATGMSLRRLLCHYSFRMYICVIHRWTDRVCLKAGRSLDGQIYSFA